jgi:hypothetical protein
MYLGTGNYAEAEALFTEALKSRIRVLGKEHDETLATAMAFGSVRLERREYTSTGSLLRETLASYEKGHPDTWQRYACESLLGTSLMEQKKYEEAEPLLLSAYAGVTQRKETIAANSRHLIEDTRTSLVKLYKIWGKPDKAAEWEAKGIN